MMGTTLEATSRAVLAKVLRECVIVDPLAACTNDCLCKVLVIWHHSDFRLCVHLDWFCYHAVIQTFSFGFPVSGESARGDQQSADDGGRARL